MIKLLLSNLLYMYLLQIIRLLFPLVLMPVLTKIFSPENFGIYIYTISCAMWLSVIVDYGFNISATRKLSALTDSAKMKDVVARTQSAKIFISIFSTIFLVFGYFFLKSFETKPVWLLLSWALGVMLGLTPVYYFQAINDLKFASIVEVLSGITLLTTVLIFVKSDADFSLLASLMLFTRILAWQIIERKVLSKLQLTYREIFNFSTVRSTLKEGWDIFLLQGAVSFYTSFNVVLVGFLCGPVAVGGYAAAERIIRTGLTFIAQASAVLFPKVVALRVQDMETMLKLRKISIIAFAGIGLVGMFSAWAASSFIIPLLFSNKFPEAEHVFNIMALVFPAIAVGNVLSFQYLMAENKEKTLNGIILFAAIASLGIGYPVVNYFGAIGMAYLWISVEWCIMIALVLIVSSKSYKKF